MVPDQEIINIKSFFESREIPLSDFWLENCIKWWREQNISENCSPTQLKNVVYEQWLLLDLRDVEIPSLPPNLKDHKKLIFNGNYCLQVMSVVDLSKPKHWQLSKIRHANVLTSSLDYDKELTNSKRMLQLTLTDGVQEVHAIEYEFIPSLNLNLTPGTKIRLTGPITVRRGNIVLEAKNIKILGGEVEEILVSNAAENVLSRALGLPENPNPISINVETGNTHINNSSSINISNLPISKNNLDTKLANNLNNNRGPVSTSHNSFDDINEEEELRIAQEVENMLEAVAGPSGTCERYKSPDLFEDDIRAKNVQNDIHNEGENEMEVIDLLNSSTESDIFKNIDVDSHLDKIDKEMQKISIKNLLKKQEGVFRVKAKFKTVVEKLTVTSTAWCFKIEVEDESGTLVAEMHTDVITKLANCHPSTIMDLKNKIDDADKSTELTIRNV